MTDVSRQYVYTQCGNETQFMHCHVYVKGPESLQSSYCAWNTKRFSSQYAELMTMPKVRTQCADKP
jgi:hypothetical protein